MGEAIVSRTVDSVSNQLAAIGGLMMGFNENVVEVPAWEVKALGVIIGRIADDLHDWNRDTRNGKER